MAILLIGGDKTNLWQSWYEEMISVADDLYDQHLAEIRQEGLNDASHKAVFSACRSGKVRSSTTGVN